MALPSSGQIAMSQINSELGRSSTAQISLDTAENGGYATINFASRNRPSATNPAYMSEWYGYDHRASAAFPLPEIGYNSTNRDTACINAATNRYVRITGDGPALIDCRIIWRDVGGTLLAIAGWYAENFTGVLRYWNGSSFTIDRFCRI